MDFGPLPAAAFTTSAQVPDFWTYAGGVYTTNMVGTPVNHGLLLEGYVAGQWWIARNSYGSGW